MQRIAFYGGSFDPPHKGHLEIARTLSEIFALDRFVFMPAFHAPHKKDRRPTSGFHRFAMLALETNDEPGIEVSNMELESPERPYTFETLTTLRSQLPGSRIFFVMGADSWQEITTWREWESVLTMVSIIVVTRPDYEIGFDHVSDAVRERIIDLRGGGPMPGVPDGGADRIFITDAVRMDVSATEIRRKLRQGDVGWRHDVTEEVAKYLEKYQIYN